MYIGVVAISSIYGCYLLYQIHKYNKELVKCDTDLAICNKRIEENKQSSIKIRESVN